jgi:hypothetical protein
LAYALLLGFDQQLLTSALDKRAKELADDLPSKDSQGDKVIVGDISDDIVEFRNYSSPVAVAVTVGDHPATT